MGETEACKLGRRSLLLSSCAMLSPAPALASYGEGANVAPPALLPSPIRPTGAMADTCEVVALGREDVCLEPKKLISVYETMQLGKAADALQDTRADDTSASPEVLRILDGALKLIELVQKNQFSEMESVLASLDTGAALSTAMAEGGDAKKLAMTVKSSLAALSTAVSKKEASPGAQALVKLSNAMCKLF